MIHRHPSSSKTTLKAFNPNRTDFVIEFFGGFSVNCKLFHWDFGLLKNTKADTDVKADVLLALVGFTALEFNEPACICPLLFCFIYLDHSHVQAGLLWQLFPDVSGGFRSGRERRFQRFQLLGLDGRPGPASLSDGALLVVFVAARVFVGQMSRFRVFPVVLRVLGIWGHARVAAGGDCQKGKENEDLKSFKRLWNLKAIYNYS